MYYIDFDCFRNLPSCKDNVIHRIEDVLHYSVQGKLQMACTGEPYVCDEECKPVSGPILELALIDPERLDIITELNDRGRFEEADRAIIAFALEYNVIAFRKEDLHFPTATLGE